VPTDDCCVPDTDDPREPSASVAPGRPVTRRLALSGLAALAGGAVAAAVGGPAAAQTGTTDTTGPADTAPDTAPATEPAPTTTAPPKRPTPADVVLLGFAQSLEYAAAQLYAQALPVIDPDATTGATVFSRHHQSYGEQIGALLGRQAPGVANQTLVNERTTAFGASSQEALGRAFYELEISLAASYTRLLGQLKGTDAVALLASIQPVEARQAVVIGQALDVAPEELMPVLEGEETGATIFTPSQYPIV
jgi:hypothetical protein